jgi:hypothetical protein
MRGDSGDGVSAEKIRLDAKTRRKFITLSLSRVKPGSGSTINFLQARTWRRKVTNLRDFIDIPYVIVGGVATRLYMPERMTDDLDILIHTSQNQRIYDGFAQKQVKQIGELSIGGTSWELPDKVVLDVISSDKPWVTVALLNPRISPDSQPVIDLPYLVLMKLDASRTTDLSDISRMLGQASDKDLDEVRKIVEMYDATSLEDLESLIQLGKLEMS